MRHRWGESEEEKEGDVAVAPGLELVLQHRSLPLDVTRRSIHPTARPALVARQKTCSFLDGPLGANQTQCRTNGESANAANSAAESGFNSTSARGSCNFSSSWPANLPVRWRLLPGNASEPPSRGSA